MTPQAKRTGVLVVRVWIEDGSLRARLTGAPDLASEEQSSTAAGSVDEIVETVRRWVEVFAAAG
jgi:hypothetical protein